MAVDAFNTLIVRLGDALSRAAERVELPQQDLDTLAEFQAIRAEFGYRRGVVAAATVSESRGPTRDTIETHPAYGVIKANRVSCRVDLFGSRVGHTGYISIQIRSAQRRSSEFGTEDYWASSNLPMVDVCLSEAQWAAFIGSMNVGSGSPCTIQMISDGGNYCRYMPGIEPEPSVSKRLSDAMDRLMSARNEVAADDLERASGILKKLPKRDQEAMADILERMRGIRENIARFHVERLTEIKEGLVSEHKAEVDAMAARAAANFGFETMQGLAAAMAADPAKVMQLLAAPRGEK